MNIADLVDSLASGAYVVTRRAAATTSAGRAVPGATSTLTITASVQTAKGRDLLRLPEGRRSTETRVLYTSTLLYTGEQVSTFDADLVAIDGRTWEVQHVESLHAFREDAGYRCIVQAIA